MSGRCSPASGPRMARDRPRSMSPIAAVVALAALAASGAAQTPASLAASCVSGGGESSRCLTAATTAYSLMGHMGLLSGAWAAVPGTASNLGTRVGGGPRMSFFARISAASWGLPDPGGSSEETSPVVPATHIGAAAGIFDGFRLMPTVGGFLATDVFGHASFLLPSGSDGFTGAVRAYTVGVRVGLFREGFTLPGASVSVARRFVGSEGFGDLGDGDVSEVTIDPSVTSVRATVGKDLFAVELLAGFGWDDYSGDATVLVPDGAGGAVVTSGPVDGSRRLYFGSAAMTFSLVLTLSVEVGWAEGLAPVPGFTGEHDPASGSAFGGLSARLIL